MTATHMRREIEEIPEAAERVLVSAADAVDEAAEALLSRDPLLIATVARGSSDHAAHFLKYAFELEIGIPGASLGPSLASIYGLTPRLDRAAVIAISQSGQSPDIVSMAIAAGKGGGQTIALVNTLPSPLAETCDSAIDIAAGKEQSVAATKSFVCSILAGLMLLARIRPESGLADALTTFPDHLREAFFCDWFDDLAFLTNAPSLYVLGRGPSLAIAGEVALKFKETCGIHAEAYSSAEVMHGPVELVVPGFPVIALTGRGMAETSVAEIADKLSEKGAPVFATSELCRKATRLPMAEAGHPLLDALLQIVPSYMFVEKLSRRRGRNPDKPTGLHKVTETV
jgi:glucosamine--fructose-6-phosphate aminotransferase (isomerizing)